MIRPARRPLNAQLLPSEEGHEALQRDLLKTGVRNIESVQGLLVWNWLNIGACCLPLILPAVGIIADAIRYAMLSAVLCVLFGWWRLNSRVKMSAPVVMIIVLQLWLTFCSYLAGYQLGRANDFESSNYFLVMAVIFYLQGAVYGHFWPQLRRQILMVLLGMFLLSALVGVAQFLKIGPAMTLAGIYNNFGNIVNWGGVSSVRPIGLASWPEWLTFQCLIGWAIIVSRIFRRPLKNWEFALATFFLLCSYMPQSRIMYLSVGLASITFAVMLFKYDRKRFPILAVSFLIAFSALFLLGRERLGYVLSTNLATDETLRYRRETGWRQAYFIYEERPWVGMGPDNDLVWEVRRAERDKWAQGEFLDNGSLLLLSWGGLPALGIFYIFLFITIGSFLSLLRSRVASIERKQLAFVLLVGILAIWNNTILNNGFTNIWLNCVLAYIGGLAMPNYREHLEELKALRPKLLRERGA